MMKWTNNDQRIKTPDQAMFDVLYSALTHGACEVEYHQQWKTIFKSQRLNYLDDDLKLTDAGRLKFTQFTHKYGGAIVKGELLKILK